MLHDGVRVPTEEEQGCLMALRFGPRAAVDLATDVVCPDRSGDVG